MGISERVYQRLRLIGYGTVPDFFCCSAKHHQQINRRTNPCPTPSHLPPLSKVRCCRPKKFGRLPEGLPHQPSPRTNPSKNRTIPRKPPTPLPPLSKGGGLTARHKPLYCCFLLVPRPPFLFTKPFCRQDGGIATSPRPTPTLPKTAPSLRLALYPCLPSKKGRWLDGIAKPLFYIIFIL